MTKKQKKRQYRQYKVLVLENTYVDGVFYSKGETVKVSKDYYNRVQAEGDRQLKVL